jgi:hypothetical protein
MDESWISGTVTSTDGGTATVDLHHRASFKQDGPGGIVIDSTSTIQGRSRAEALTIALT